MDNEGPKASIAQRDRRPLGVQVYLALRERIRLGGYLPGSRLPSEALLAQEYGVSRVTVREALRLLQQGFFIESVHGRGHFVLDTSKLIEAGLADLFSVTELMHGCGYNVETQTLILRHERAAVAAPLQLTTGDSALRLERLRLSDGVPMIYSIDIFRASDIADHGPALRAGASLLGTFDALGIDIAYAQTTVSAAAVPRSVVARGFPRVPCVLMEQLAFTAARQPVLYSFDYHRGDKFKFSVLRARRKHTESPAV